MTTKRKDSMGEAATNSHLKMEKEPCSIPQASGWTNNAIRIGGAIVHGLAGSGPLILSCVCLFLAYKNREKRSKLLQRSLSLAALHSGKVTLNNILASAEVRHDSSAVNLAFKEFKILLNSDQIHFTKLQVCGSIVINLINLIVYCSINWDMTSCLCIHGRKRQRSWRWQDKKIRQCTC